MVGLGGRTGERVTPTERAETTGMMMCSATCSTSTRAGAGRSPAARAEGLQERRRSDRLGDDGRDVPGGGHETTAGVVKGGVACADRAPGPGETVLGSGDLHTGITVSRQVAVVADADSEAVALLVGDTERFEEIRQGSRDGRLRPDEHGEGEGFERHRALR